MNFLVLIVAILIEHFIEVGRYRERLNVITPYFDVVDNWFGKKDFFASWLGLVVAIIPALFLVLIIGTFFKDVAGGILYPLFSLVVLLYCLGGFEFHEQSAPNELMAQASKKFTVIFWFMVLGPLGAVLSRLSDDLADTKRWHNISELAFVVSELLAWIPIRLLCLSFALVGNFVAVIRLWLDHLFTGIHNNMNLLLQASTNACEQAAVEPSQMSVAIIRLLSRSLLIWLAVLALVIII